MGIVLSPRRMAPSLPWNAPPLHWETHRPQLKHFVLSRKTRPSSMLIAFMGQAGAAVHLVQPLHLTHLAVLPLFWGLELLQLLELVPSTVLALVALVQALLAVTLVRHC